MKMLEIVIVVTVIGILATIVTPKLANMMDIVILDREVKRLGSEISLLQSISRTSDRNFLWSEESNPISRIVLDVNEYELIRDNKVIDVHKLPNDITIKVSETLDSTLYFNSSTNLLHGDSGNIMLTSKLGNKKYIYVDSVGRWSISENERYDQ